MTGKLNYSTGSFEQRLTDDPGCFTGAVILYASGDCCGWVGYGYGPAVGTLPLRAGSGEGADLGKNLSGKGKYNNSRQPVSCIRHPVSGIPYFKNIYPPIFVFPLHLYLGFMNNPGERLNFRCVQTCK